MSAVGVLIVGAGLGGLRTAQGLRRNGYDGTIRLIGSEPHLPYDRPPLSKGVLVGDTSPESLRYVDTAELCKQEVDFLAGTTATCLHPRDRVVLLDSGQLCEYEHLVLATGAKARQPFSDAPAGVHTLRSLEDAVVISSQLSRAQRLVVIGAGFIGLEVASSARVRGVKVTLLEAAPRALGRSLDERSAAAITSLATDAGVDVRFGQTVSGFSGDKAVDGVVLAGGNVVPADLVVVGVGAAPEASWLVGSGVPLLNGAVICEASGRVQDTDRVWAVGDVAAWPDTGGAVRRREHWTAAVDQANVVAQNIADGGQRVLDGPDYVWSEQFGHKISIVGQVAQWDDMRVLDGRASTLAVLYAARGRLVGACVVGQMPLVLKCRRSIAASAPIDELELWQNAA
ncbi:MAG TPA: FAD-dependent oxidoreductase [Actinomycetales bacterium]|nr:FAD-dependent oxidoreductase [Actinomycetales bacterium]